MHVPTREHLSKVYLDLQVAPNDSSAFDGSDDCDELELIETAYSQSSITLIASAPKSLHVEKGKLQSVHHYYYRLMGEESVLSLSEKELFQRLAEFERLGLSIEEMSQANNSWQLKNAIKTLNLIIKAGHYKGELDLLRHLLADMIFSSAIGLSLTGIDDDTRHCITSLSHNQVLRTIERIYMCKDLRDINTLCHIDARYPSLNLSQRLLYLGLGRVESGLRDVILHSQAFESMIKRKDLASWMLAASGSLRQEYLNTCIATAYTQEILHHVPDPVSLYFLCAAAHNSLANRFEELKNQSAHAQESLDKAAYNKGPSICEVIETRLAKTKQDLAVMKSNFSALLSKEETNFEALVEIVEMWNHTMQRNLTIANIFEPTFGEYPKEDYVCVNSNKALKENWNLSAFWLVVKTIFTPPPLSKKRARLFQDRYQHGPISVEGTDLLLADLIELPACKEECTFRFSMSKKSFKTLSSSKQEQAIESLWKAIFQSGGAQFTIPGHGLYLIATQLQGAPHFAVGDPMDSKFKFYNLKAMIKYFQHSGLEIEIDVLQKTGQYLKLKQLEQTINADAA